MKILKGHVVDKKTGAFDIKSNTYADLPNALENDATVAMVKNSQGTFLLSTRKLAGIYESRGGTWHYLGTALAKATLTEVQEGTETAVKRFSPADLKAAAEAHGGTAVWQRDALDHQGLSNPMYMLETKNSQWRIRRINAQGGVAVATTTLEKQSAWSNRRTLTYGVSS